jgi:hypothetical protein
MKSGKEKKNQRTKENQPASSIEIRYYVIITKYSDDLMSLFSGRSFPPFF